MRADYPDFALQSRHCASEHTSFCVPAHHIHWDFLQTDLILFKSVRKPSPLFLQINVKSQMLPCV